MSDRVDLWQGVVAMFVSVLSHRTTRRCHRIAEYAHAGVFFGFLLAAVGTTIIFIDYDIFEPLFDVSLWAGKLHLWFSPILDLGHLALMIGLLVMIARRAAWTLPKLGRGASCKTAEASGFSA